MKMLRLLIVVFSIVAGVLACPCLNCSDTRGVIQRRWTHSFDLEPNSKHVHYRWPVDNRGVSNIKYCYPDADSAFRLGNLMRNAWSIWQTALGGQWGADNGHRLNMEEVRGPDGNEYLRCFKSRKNNKSPWEWNPDVPKDTLVVRHSQESGPVAAGMHSSLAYRTGDNYVQFFADVEAFEVAHELGHVFGLQHEHQRSDRDNHVHWNCAAMMGFKEVEQIVRDEGTRYTMNEICWTAGLNRRYRRLVPAFAPETFAVFETGDTRTGTEYDAYSIMHYNSYSFSHAPGNCFTLKQKEFCPLMKYTSNDRGPNAAMDFIAPNKKPSDKDVEGLKQMYPWEGH